MNTALNTALNAAQAAREEWRALLRRPWPWVILGIAVLLTQGGFWIGMDNEPEFRPRTLLDSLGSCVNNLAHIGPEAAVILMGSMQRSGWTGRNPAVLLAGRTATAVGMMAVMPIAAFTATVAAHGMATAILGHAGEAYGMETTVFHEASIYGRALWVTLTYVAMAALLSLLTGSRAWGTGITLTYMFLEYIVVDLVIEWFEPMRWVFGLTPSHLRYNWVWPDSALWGMENILGLEDTPQALLVLGLHAGWMSAAACLIASRRNRMECTSHLGFSLEREQRRPRATHQDY